MLLEGVKSLQEVRELYQVFTDKELFIDWLLAINVSIGKKLVKKKAEIESDQYVVDNKEIDMRTAPQVVKSNILYDGDVLQMRWDMCSSCEFLKDDRCLKCKCWMRSAIRLKSKACPIGKFDKYTEGIRSAYNTTI